MSGSQHVERGQWPVWLSLSLLPLQLVADHGQLAADDPCSLVTYPEEEGDIKTKEKSNDSQSIYIYI